MKGQTLLKASGTLLLFSAAVSVICALTDLVNNEALASDGLMGMGVFAVMQFLIELIFAIAQLIAGLTARRYYHVPAKTEMLLTFGVVLIILALLFTIFSGTISGFRYRLILGFSIPILYTAGALLNLSAGNSQSLSRRQK